MKRLSLLIAMNDITGVVSNDHPHPVAKSDIVCPLKSARISFITFFYMQSSFFISILLLFTVNVRILIDIVFTFFLFALVSFPETLPENLTVEYIIAILFSFMPTDNFFFHPLSTFVTPGELRRRENH